MTGYSSKTDAVEQYILPALGEYAADYDIDAIFDEAFKWVDGVDGGFKVDGSNFYAIAAANDISISREIASENLKAEER